MQVRRRHVEDSHFQHIANCSPTGTNHAEESRLTPIAGMLGASEAATDKGGARGTEEFDRRHEGLLRTTRHLVLRNSPRLPVAWCPRQHFVPPLLPAL